MKKNLSWEIKVSILKDTILFKELLRVVFIVGVIFYIFMFVINITDNDLGNAIISSLYITLILIGVIFILIIISVFILALIYKGKLYYKYELTDKKIKLTQLKYNKKIGKITAVAGALSNNYTVVGAGLLASNNTKTTDFKNVEKVIVNNKKSCIELISFKISKNIIYIPLDKFEEIKEIILDKCSNAKIIEK